MKSALRVYWKGYEVYWGSVTEDESKQAYREATIALAEGASLDSIAASNPQMTEEALLRCEKAAKKLISIVSSKESVLRGGTSYVRVAPVPVYKQLQQPAMPAVEAPPTQGPPHNDAEQNKDAGQGIPPVAEAVPQADLAAQQLAQAQQQLVQQHQLVQAQQLAQQQQLVQQQLAAHQQHQQQ